MDHFYVAYPESSCVAVGWDYWDLRDRTAAEADAAFQRGMGEFECVLQGSVEGWLPGFPAGACERAR